MSDKELIKRAKINTGLNSKQLAKFLGVSEGTLYNWENGNSKGKTWPLWALEKCGLQTPQDVA